MITANILLFLVSFIILWYVVRYRIHIHVTYQPRKGGDARCPQTGSNLDRASVRRGQQNSAGPSEIFEDPYSALTNQGVSKSKARGIATRLASEPAEFETLLRKALKEAA